MPYLIDSDLIIDHLTDVSETTQLIENLASEGIAISIISYMEVYQTILRSYEPKAVQAKLRILVDPVPILPLSIPVAERCARLREKLKKEGKRVKARAFDLVIAATALEYNLTLVTRNYDDYNDILELKLIKPETKNS